MRQLPAVRRFLLAVLRPVKPQVTQFVNWLEADSFARWFARWQGSQQQDDAVIRSLLSHTDTSIIVTLTWGVSRRATEASLAAQVGVIPELMESAAQLESRAVQGRFLVHLHAGDELVRHALAEFVITAASEAKPLIIYSDEGCRSSWFRRQEPWLKSVFDPDLLLQQASLGRAVAYDTGLLSRHGLLHMRGHRLMLAATRAAVAEAGPGAVMHLPSVLLYRRASWKPVWREDTSRAAIEGALARVGTGVVLMPPGSGRHGVPRLRWPLPATPPQVTIIVPTRDGTSLMKSCIEGLLHQTNYPAFDILVCDNESKDARLIQYFSEWGKDPRFRVLDCPGPFNYSAINNYAARQARGEILLFLNNDTEVRHPDWLTEMVSHATRPEIGAVGARLLFSNGRVQHSGVVLGLGGVAGHDMLFAPAVCPGANDLLCVARRVSAVTAACMAVRREAFLAVGGFDEVNLPIAYNDVDLCLRLRASGLHNLATSHAELTHEESATRGDDMSPTHRTRWESECATMLERWGEALRSDPYFSPLLGLDSPTRILAEPPRRLAPWRRVGPVLEPKYVNANEIAGLRD